MHDPLPPADSIADYVRPERPSHRDVGEEEPGISDAIRSILSYGGAATQASLNGVSQANLWQMLQGFLGTNPRAGGEGLEIPEGDDENDDQGEGDEGDGR